MATNQETIDNLTSLTNNLHITQTQHLSDVEDATEIIVVQSMEELHLDLDPNDPEGKLLQLFGPWISGNYTGDCFTPFYAKDEWRVEELISPKKGASNTEYQSPAKIPSSPYCRWYHLPNSKESTPTVSLMGSTSLRKDKEDGTYDFSSSLEDSNRIISPHVNYSVTTPPTRKRISIKDKAWKLNGMKMSVDLADYLDTEKQADSSTILEKDDLLQSNTLEA
ncbi:hypothetical protein L6452_32912 [Arctium lappa]|uniref:Uncharacterized protein n=1 Tax=Arctium lappa TaxID=4217 RepID=A0ACB8Z743_ARCLA|nr:hypothetical protein L6452_32912 [Arctium lappa]